MHHCLKILCFILLTQCQGSSEYVKEKPTSSPTADLTSGGQLGQAGGGSNTGVILKNGTGLIPSSSVYSGGRNEYTASTQTFGDGVQGPAVGVYLRPSGMLDPGPALIALHGTDGMSDVFLANLLQFVSAGYRILALDMYGLVPGNSIQGKSLESSLSQRGLVPMLTQINQARNYLVQSTGATKVGIVGWGTGGKWSFTIGSSSNTGLAVAIDYYGDPSILDTNRGQITIPLLGYFAELDPDIKPAAVITLGEKFIPFPVEVDLRIYPNVSPGFLEQENTTSYLPNAEQQVFKETLNFLNTNLVK